MGVVIVLALIASWMFFAGFRFEKSKFCVSEAILRIDGEMAVAANSM